MTSTPTITKVLVKPFQLGQIDLARTFRNVLAEYVEIVPMRFDQLVETTVKDSDSKKEKN